MWKTVVVVAICLAPVAMSAQQQTPAREHQRETQQPPPTITITTNESSAHDEQSRADKPQGWHKFVTWPEGIVTWALILTLGAIVWQAIETRKAAKATQEAAKATEKSVKLQEVQMRQWVEIGNWEGAFVEHQEFTGLPSLQVTFEVINPTNWPLTVEISVNINRLSLFQSGTTFLSPNSPYTVNQSITLNEKEVAKFRESQLAVPVQGRVTYRY